MEIIKLIYVSEHKKNIKTLFYDNGVEGPRVIGNVFKKDNLYPNSSFDYLFLKAYYQKMEKEQIQHEEYSKKSNSLVYWIEVRGQKIRVLSKQKNYSILKIMAIYNNLLENDKLCCSYCKKNINEEQVTLDHWLPQSSGVIDTVENLNVSCFRCNRSKGSIHPNEDTKLLKLWTKFIQQDEEKHILDYLLNNNYYSIEDGNYLMKKLSLTIQAKATLCMEMLIHNIKVEGQMVANIDKIIDIIDGNDILMGQLNKIKANCFNS